MYPAIKQSTSAPGRILEQFHAFVQGSLSAEFAWQILSTVDSFKLSVLSFFAPHGICYGDLFPAHRDASESYRPPSKLAQRRLAWSRFSFLGEDAWWRKFACPDCPADACSLQLAAMCTVHWNTFALCQWDFQCTSGLGQTWSNLLAKMRPKFGPWFLICCVTDNNIWSMRRLQRRAPAEFRPEDCYLVSSNGFNMLQSWLWNWWNCILIRVIVESHLQPQKITEARRSLWRPTSRLESVGLTWRMRLRESTGALRRHWNDGECRGNYPKQLYHALSQVLEWLIYNVLELIQIHVQ